MNLSFIKVHIRVFQDKSGCQLLFQPDVTPRSVGTSFTGPGKVSNLRAFAPGRNILPSVLASQLFK